MFEAETLAQQPEMESAEEIHRQTQAALIFDNKHATVTMEVCWGGREGGRGSEGGRDGEGGREGGSTLMLCHVVLCFVCI